MKKSEYSEPAFPSGTGGYYGMSLRDFFAGMALCGMCSDIGLHAEHNAYAEHAYKFADAMLKEREK